MSAGPPRLELNTAAERPDLWERRVDSASVWPESNLHGDVVNRWWPLLVEEMTDCQFVLYDPDADRVVAEGHTAPLRWDGSDDALPASFDDTITLAFGKLRGGVAADTLCALAAEPAPSGAAAWRSASYPESGDYVLPEGLAPLHVDRDADLGSYWEPNVWMVHPDA